MTYTKHNQSNGGEMFDALKAAVSSTPDLVYVFDLNYRFTFVNDALLKMWGRTLEESMGKNLLEIGYEPWHAEMHEREIDQVIATKQPVRGEVPFHHATLGERIYDYIFVPVLDDKGKVEAVAGTTRDITEQKQTEMKLQKMNETLEERVKERTAALLSYQDQLRSLVAELSHAEERERQRLATDLHDNLGQTLAVGKMKLDLLQTGRLPERAASDLTAELAGLMDDAIRYTRALMSDLNPPPSLEREDLAAGIRWVAKKMKKHDLQVTLKDDGQPKPLSEEVRTTLRQCTRELLFNVVKHAGVGQARVVLSRQGNRVRVSVEDQGEGFDMEGRQPAPTEEGGFGLFNIHERMDLLGGRLQVISEPGKGTQMILDAPVMDKEKSDRPVPANKKVHRAPPGVPERVKSHPQIRVLLVDDHQMMREGLRKMIEEEEDLTVIAEASEGEEGVRLASELSPDVVVMDVNMPGLSGIDATRQLTSGLPHIRVIGLSLHEEESVAAAMRGAGASAYLTKSEVFETLCATIRSEAITVNSQITADR